MKKFFSITLCLTLVLLISCSPSSEDLNDLNSQNIIADIEAVLTQKSTISSKNSKRPQPPIWADCMSYTGIVVPATFKPESDPFDELYAMPDATFMGGKPLISDSKPGDKDYNGGRWHLNVLKSDVAPGKYANACSEEDLDLDDFDSTAMYFGCPLRPDNK
tara:strand:+ start:544 stop:1026 length:483 start_codon:yes stop_codon:yes gene_type:complete